VNPTYRAWAFKKSVQSKNKYLAMAPSAQKVTIKTKR